MNVLPLQGPSVCGLNPLEWPSPLPFAANCALWDSSQDLHLFCGFCCGDFLPPMATSSGSNKMEQQPPDWALLQLDVATNQVNWSHVRHYMTERFSHPATSFVQRQGMALYDHVDRSQICDHILRMRVRPSLTPTSPARCSTLSSSCRMTSYFGHPGLALVMPINVGVTCGTDAGIARSPIVANYIAKAGEHSEMFGFRAWIASVEPRFWYSVYCLEPNFSGRLPLYTIDFQDLQTCLATQPFITTELHSKHDWKDSVPSPPTYIIEVPSRVQPLASNFNEPERVHNRKMRNRDTTPRGQRPTQSEVPPHQRDPFLSAQIPSDHVQSCPSPRFGPGTPPRSRQPTGSENWRPSTLPPTTSGSPISFGPSSASTANSHGPQRIAAPLTNPVPTPSPSYAAMPIDQAQPSTGPEFDWNADSEPDLPLPPASLKISPSPVRAPPTFSTDIVTNVPNWFTKPIPSRQCRDLHAYI